MINVSTIWYIQSYKTIPKHVQQISACTVIIMLLFLQYATVLQLNHLIVGIFIKLVGFNFMHFFDIRPMRL